MDQFNGGGSRLNVIESNKLSARLELSGSSASDAYEWLDRQLSEHGLQPASKARLPYELPPEVAGIGVFRIAEETNQLGGLTEWFDLANTHLTRFAVDHSDLTPGPSPVRCWPHHFDNGTYVQLQAGDFETARGIGIGMSPGDESYDQPYFYINPWPHIDPAGLPEPPVPGHWHTEGFVGAIATGEEILTLDDVSRGLPEFVKRTFDIGRAQLDA